MRTDYWAAVYEIVGCIPEGRVTTYGAIADYLGLGSARMVGWALRHALEQAELIPAHRVVNREGLLSGRLHFSTPTEMAEKLRAEGVRVEEDRVVDFSSRFWHPRALTEERASV